MRIRRLKIKDYKDVVLLFDKYRVFYKKPSDLAKADSFIKDRLTKKESVIFVAYEGEQAVGFTQLYPYFSSVSAVKRWTLNDLYVEEAHRKTGIATKLINKVLDFAKKDGAIAVQLQTAKDNATAKKLYEDIGFQWQSSESPYDSYKIDIAS